LNFFLFLFSLRALVLVLFCPNPDSLTGTQTLPHFAVHSVLAVVSPSPYLSPVSPLVPSSVSPLLSQGDAFKFTLWQNNTT
jgi:hypothetical protein